MKLNIFIFCIALVAQTVLSKPSTNQEYELPKRSILNYQFQKKPIDVSNRTKASFLRKFLIAYIVHYIAQTHNDTILFFNPKLEKSTLRHGMLLAHYALGMEITNGYYGITLENKEERQLPHILGFLAALCTYKPLTLFKPLRFLFRI